MIDYGRFANPMRGAARRYYVVDQVQGGLWQQVDYFHAKSDAEKFRRSLRGKTRVVHTYPSARRVDHDGVSA